MIICKSHIGFVMSIDGTYSFLYFGYRYELFLLVVCEILIANQNKVNIVVARQCSSVSILLSLRNGHNLFSTGVICLLYLPVNIRASIDCQHKVVVYQ